MRKTQLTAAGFEESRRRPQTEECGQPLEAGKGKGQILPESLQNIALDFSPVRLTYRTVRW